MAHKVVERIEGPFHDDEEGDVAYVMVYTHLDDRVQSVAFDQFGSELARLDKDVRKEMGLEVGARPSVKFATSAEAKQKAPPKPGAPKPGPQPRPRPEPTPPPKPGPEHQKLR